MNAEKFLAELGLILGAAPGTLKLESRLADFPAWDSMGKMATLTLIDGDVGVPVPPGLLQKWRTVGEIMDFVRPHLRDA